MLRDFKSLVGVQIFEFLCFVPIGRNWFISKFSAASGANGLKYLIYELYSYLLWLKYTKCLI